jgi:hypothetical protein
MKRTVAYYLLSSLSLLGDTIFLYYVSLHLLQFEHGGLLSGIVLGMDAFFEIAIGPFLSRFIDAIDGLGPRLKRSLWIQALLIVLSFVPALFASPSSGPTTVLLLSIALLRFLFLIDMQLKVALPLTLNREHTIPLTQTLSLSVLSQRCILLVSSSLAPLILGATWFFACGLNSVTYIFSLFALLLMLTVIKKGPQTPVLENTEEIPQGEKERWVIWNCLFQFLTHLSFGSVVFVLTRSMLLTENSSVWQKALKGPAPIYAGLLVALLLMIFLPHRGTFVAKNAKRVCLAIFGLGFTILASAFVSPGLQPTIFFILGIINGFSLVGSDSFIQQKMAGKSFVKAFAKGTASAKIGVLLSLLLAGLCMDSGLSTTQLLTGFGFAGVIVALALSFAAFFLEKKLAFQDIKI